MNKTKTALKILIAFDDMIAGMFCLKIVRLNYTHCFITRTFDKQENRQIAFNYLSDIGFEDSMKI